MSSIDERIVILTFDNQQFEGNVKTSLETLERLKKGLNLEEASKGLTAVSSSAKSFDLSGVSSAVEDVKSRFSTLGVVGMTVVSELTKTFMGLGSKLIGAISGPLIQGGWKRALNVEQATFQMRGLLGETEEGAAKIKDIMGAVQESVMGTAYGADQAARVASQLVATGVEDGEQMLGYLKGVAGAAAMTGGDYESIGHIFTTVAGQGKLMAVQLNQFAYKGLNVAATLSKQMGITEAEFRDMVSKGKITFDMFAAGMEQAFGEHATKANETFTGSLANMKAALARIGQEVATPSLQNLHDIFISLRHLIDAVHVAIMPFINTLNTALGSSTKKAVGFIDNLTFSLKKATGGIKDDEKKLSDSVRSMAESFKESAEDIDLSSQKLTGEQLEKFSDSGVNATAILSEKLGITQQEFHKMVEAGEVSYSMLLDLTKVTSDYSKELDTGAARAEKFHHSTEKVTTPLENFVSGLKTLASTIGQIASSFGKAFKEVFSGTFSNAIMKVSEGFKSLAESFRLTSPEADGLKTVFKVLLSILKSVFKIIGTAGYIIGNFITIIAGGIGSILEFVGSLDQTNEAFDETSRKGKLIIAISEVIKSLGTAIGEFKEKVKTMFETVKNSDGFQRLQESFTNLWSALKTFLGPYVDKFITKIQDLANMKADFTWLETFAEFLSNAADRIANFVDALATGENPIQAFFDIFKISEDGLGDLGGFSSAINSFLDSASGFFSGLNLKEKFSGVKEAFTEGVKANIDESMTPESLLETIKGRFKAFGEFLADVDWGGILKHIGKIALIIATVRTIWNLGSVFKSVSGFINNLKRPFSVFGKGGSGGGLARSVKQFAIAIGIIAASLFVVATIPTDNLIKAGIAIGGCIAALVAAVKLMNGGSIKGGANMIAFGITIGIMASAIKQIAGISGSDLVKAELAILGIIGIFTMASKISGGSIGAAATFGAMAIAITLLIPAITAISLIPTKNLVKAGVAIAAFLLEFSIATRLAQSCVGGAAAMALMAASITLLVPAVLVFGNMPADKLLKAGVTILGLVVSLAAATRIAQSAIGGAAAMALMAGAVSLLIAPMLVFGNMGVDKLLKGGITIVALLTSLALATKIAQSAVGGAGAMAIMGLAVNTLIPPMLVFGNMPAEKLLKGGATIVALMISLAAATRIAQGNVKGAASMLLMAIPLTATALALSALAVHDWDKILAAGTALSEVMLAVAAATRLSSGNAKGAVSMLAMCLPLIAVAVVLAKLAAYDWHNILAAGTALSEVFLSMSAAIAVLSKIPISGGIKAAVNMAIFIGVLAGIIAALGALNKIEGFNDLMSGGADILGIIGQAIGNFISGIVSGFSEGATSGLPALGENLSGFAANVQPFIDSMKEVDSSVLDGIGTLASAVLMITGADFLEGITSFIGGGQSSLVSFGQQLNAFAPYFVSFADQVSGIDAGAVSSSANAAKSLAAFADAIPNSGGLVAKVTGDNDLGTFGAQLAVFGPAFADYCASVVGIDASAVTASASAAGALAEFANKIPNSGGLVAKVTGDNDLVLFGLQLSLFAPAFKNYCSIISGVDTGAAEASATAASALAEFANNIPNSGGLVAKVTGENDLGTFGAQLAVFGPLFKVYCDSVQGIDTEAVETSARAAEAITAFATTIPNSGGLVSKVTGDNDLGAFAAALQAFGPAFKAYCDSIAGIDASEVETSAKAAEAIAAFSDNIPNSGGLVAKVTGDNDLGAFGEQLAAFGPNFASFANDISGVDPSAVTASTSAATAVAAFAEAVPNTGGFKALFADNSLSKFGEELVAFGAQMAAYSDAISDIKVVKMMGVNDVMPSLIDMANVVSSADLGGSFSDFGTSLISFAESLSVYTEMVSAINLGGVTSAVSATTALVGMATMVGGVDSSALSTFGKDLETAGKKGVDDFIKSFTNANGRARDAVVGLVNSAASGVSSTNLSAQLSAIGANAGQALADGLLSKAASVRAAGAALGNAGSAGTKGALKINSPSKVFIEIGEGIGEGLIMGIESMDSAVQNASASLGGSTYDAIANPLKKIQNLLSNDMDVNPVITPVLDLSNVTNGAGQISSMFNNPAFGLAGSYGVMNAAAGFTGLQNTNSELVDAIKSMDRNNNSNTWNITVDGAQNPEDFADRLVRRIKSNSRMR